ncbi:MAG: peptidase S8 [Lachnospiraceae bacterium]|nr:peptidase S8 [Lachnospiraceae bacterium]
MNKVRKKLGIDNLHLNGIKGSNVNIAILDTGAVAHPDIENNIVTFKDFVNGNQELYDDNGHGTHIAGICSGNGNMSDGLYRGIAPETGLIILKVLDENGIGKEDNVVEAVRWIAENRNKYSIEIVNISFGSDSDKLLTITKSIEYLWNIGLIVVASAGNNGPDVDSITAPGNSKKVITVGALENNEIVRINNRRVRDYSGRGKLNEYKPEVIAPANKIVSCNSNYNVSAYSRKSGTSMATPIVSGGIALYKSIYHNCSNQKIKNELCKSCKNMNMDINRQGYGMIDIFKFIYK